MRKRVKVSAPGKLILSGEHAVVYGYPALVAAVNKRLSVNERLEIKSDIPVGCGMGSSAAYAVAISTIKLGDLDKEKINEMAYELEKKQHGNPSGADNTVCTYGGFLWYRKEVEGFKIFSQIEQKRSALELLVHNTGKPQELTGEMVSYVGELYKNSPKKISMILQDIEKMTRDFLKFLMGQEINLLELLKENERCLEELGVVSESTKKLVRDIEKIGGAAKVSGAGGKQGASGIILIYHPDMEKLRHFLSRRGREVMHVKLGEEGVRYDGES